MSTTNEVPLALSMYLNREFSSLSDEEAKTGAFDVATIIAERTSKSAALLHRSLKLRDVRLAMLMLGLDMPVLDLLEQQVWSFLKSDYVHGNRPQ